jgi:hypothetical protein
MVGSDPYGMNRFGAGCRPAQTLIEIRESGVHQIRVLPVQ